MELDSELARHLGPNLDPPVKNAAVLWRKVTNMGPSSWRPEAESWLPEESMGLSHEKDSAVTV